MSYYGYIADSSSDIRHHGVKGMKWGVRKAKDSWQKHWRKKASRWTKINDFRNSSVKRKSDLKKQWIDYDAKVYTGKIKDDKYTYRANKRRYKSKLREANRDISNMTMPFITSAQREAYINASPKGRRALNLLNTAQAVGTTHLAAAGVAAGTKAINKAYKERKNK